MADKKRNSNYSTEKKTQKSEEKTKRKQEAKKKALVKDIVLKSLIALLVIGALVTAMYFGGAFNYSPEGTEDVLISFEGSYGSIHVELYGNDAPETVKSFLALVKGGYFTDKTVNAYKDGNLYLGDEQSEFKNGIVGEFSANGKENKIPFEEGTLVMARGEDYNSAYGRFFIVTKETDVRSLKGNYAAFGRITEGMDAVKNIISGITPEEDGRITLEQQVNITSISSHASHSH